MLYPSRLYTDYQIPDVVKASPKRGSKERYVACTFLPLTNKARKTTYVHSDIAMSKSGYPGCFIQNIKPDKITTVVENV